MALFKLKHFSLQNTKSAMKITTDSILLGSWVDVHDCKAVLDVGTGTGIIALMIAQRSDDDCKIVGIDVDVDSIEESSENFLKSPWPTKLCAILTPLNDYLISAKKEQLDLIVSHPPFFEDSLKSQNSRKSKARHTDSLPLGELIDAAIYLLKPSGRLSVILPAENSSSFVVDAICKGLFLQRECFVKTSENKPFRRVLLEFGKDLIIGDDFHKTLVAEYN